MGESGYGPRPWSPAGDRRSPDPLRLRRHGPAHRHVRRAGAHRAHAALGRSGGDGAHGAARARALRTAGPGPDLRQARPGHGHARGPADAGVDHRTGQAAERGAGAAIRAGAPAAGRRPGRRSGSRVRTPGGNPVGGRLAGPDPPRLAGRWQRGGAQGPPSGHPRYRRSRPAADGAAGRDRGGARPGPASLPPGRGGAAVLGFAAAGTGLCRRGPQRRAHRRQLRRPRRGGGAPGVLGVDQRTTQRAGVPARHRRHRPGRGGRGWPGPGATGRHRCRHRAEDGAGGRLLPRRSAPGQHLLPARRTHRGDRLRHGRARVRAAPLPDRAVAARTGRARIGAGGRRADGVGRGCGRGRRGTPAGRCGRLCRPVPRGATEGPAHGRDAHRRDHHPA